MREWFQKLRNAFHREPCVRLVYGSPHLYETRDFTLFYLDKYFEEVRKIDVYSLEDEKFVEDFLLNPTPEKLEEAELRVKTLKKFRVEQVKEKIVKDLKKELGEYVKRYS